MTTGSIPLRRCARCKRDLPLDSFGELKRKNTKPRRDCYCRPCNAAKARDIYNRKKEDPAAWVLFDQTGKRKPIAKKTRKPYSPPDTFGERLEQVERTARYTAKALGVAWEVVDYAMIVVKYDGMCQVCGDEITETGPPRSPGTLAFLHPMPLKWGGPHTLANIRPVHLRCMGRYARGIVDSVLG